MSASGSAPHPVVLRVIPIPTTCSQCPQTLPWQATLLDSVFLDSLTPGVQRGPLQSTDRFLGASLWHSTHQDPLHPQSTLSLWHTHCVASTLCQNHWMQLATITLRQCAPKKCTFSYETSDLKLLSCPVPHSSPVSEGDELNLRICPKSQSQELQGE